MSGAYAHGAVHVNVGELTGHSPTYHPDGKISICLTGHPLLVYLCGTPEELDEFLTDVRCAVTAAVAAAEVPA